MAKKNKEQEPTASLNSVTNRDILQRLNFLYQASAYLNTIAPHPASVGKEAEGTRSTQVRRARREDMRKKARHPATTSDLSRSYVTSMRVISQKATVKMDPTIKRTICKKCNTVLIPGTTEQVRVNSSRTHGHVVSYMCTACNTTRRIPAPPVLDPDAPPESSTLPGNAATGSASDAHPDAMEVDSSNQRTSAAQASSASPKQPNPVRRKKKGPTPRLPPLFQRKGHVVFRGNERLESDDAI